MTRMVGKMDSSFIHLNIDLHRITGCGFDALQLPDDGRVEMEVSGQQKIALTMVKGAR
jgi:hypothetical protein